MKHFDFLTKPTRSILVLILSAVIVFGTVGCSSDNQSSDEPTDSPAPSSTASVETNGDFYTYDQDFSTYSPGTLLRSESFTFEDWPDVPAWKILYITEVTQDDQPVNVLSSGYVLGPSTTTDATLSATPLIALAHGTSGYVPRCAPTILGEEVMLSGVPNLSEILNRGYAIVGTDYPGMGTNGLNPYLIGQDEAKAVLDSIRAAGQISELTLTNHNTIMGHSQGGGAALWTGILAPKYAPELNIAGVIAAAPASNIPQVFKDFGTNDLDRHIQAYALASFSNYYSDVILDDYLLAAEKTEYETAVNECLTDPNLLQVSEPFLATKIDGTVLESRLTENVPLGKIDGEVLIAQGNSDTIIFESMQSQYVPRLLKDNPDLIYQVYEGEGHMSLVMNPQNKYAQDLLAFLDRTRKTL